MNRQWAFELSVWLLVWIIGLSCEAAWSQQTPPTEDKGLNAPVITSLDLGPEIEGMQERQLRMRKVTLEPGGVIAVHSHKDRPLAVYLMQGTLTEFRPDGRMIEHQEGEAWALGKAITDWAENRGSKPVILIAVDIFKEE